MRSFFERYANLVKKGGGRPRHPFGDDGDGHTPVMVELMKLPAETKDPADAISCPPHEFPVVKTDDPFRINNSASYEKTGGTRRMFRRDWSRSSGSLIYFFPPLAALT